MTVHDETKDILVITVIFFIIFYRKRRHVFKLLLVLIGILFNKALILK